MRYASLSKLALLAGIVTLILTIIFTGIAVMTDWYNGGIYPLSMGPQWTLPMEMLFASTCLFAVHILLCPADD